MKTTPCNAASAVVLYVEDNLVNVTLMQALLARRPGVRLVVAGSGREALELGPTLQPALLLLDQRLPDCDGTTLLPLLRRHPAFALVPAVWVTAETNSLDDLRGTGFCELWPKPLDLRFVLRRIDALLAPVQTPAPAD